LEVWNLKRKTAGKFRILGFSFEILILRSEL
jgi:hypothetical protein